MKRVETLVWQAKDGQEIKAVITVIREMETQTVDGYELAKKRPVEMLSVDVYKAGKVVGRSYNKPKVVATPSYPQKFVDQIKTAGGYALLTDKVVICEDRYNEIMALIDTMIAEVSQDPEYAEYKGIKIAKDAEQAKAIAEMQAVEVPAAAVAAYNRYHGSSERAWEAEDEQAWALLERWGRIIEVQQGIHAERAQELFDEMRRE